MGILKKVASLKAKYLRANYSKFMTKKMGKAIMLRKNQVAKRIFEKRTSKLN